MSFIELLLPIVARSVIEPNPVRINKPAID
jgi:hypothetical protein